MLKAIEISTANAGYSIMTSGIGLALGFLALCIFPIDALLVTGLATCLSIIIIIAINLTIIPTALITFPEFWENSWTRGDCFQGWELPNLIRPEPPASGDTSNLNGKVAVSDRASADASAQDAAVAVAAAVAPPVAVAVAAQPKRT
eukprot:3329687-Pleurochrysis_carterae.AAC.1